MKHEEAEMVMRGKVDLILDSISSLDEKIKIADPQLKKIIDSLKKFGKEYYDPYAVAVRPGIDEISRPKKKV